MKKTFFILFLALPVMICRAQNRATVKGIVADSLDKAPLESATVAVVHQKDSSLVSYTLTDEKGAFLLRNLPAEQNLKIVISYVAYQNYRKIINLDKGEDINIGRVYLSRKELNEVLITGERIPVIINKDTIEFNAEAFKTRPNAVVEELLKKLPGVQVNNDGSITVNGKSVSKLTIDGKEFFGDDPKVASKNLDASLIDKVQILDDREDDPDHLIDESKVNKIINLKLKKALKKSVFGKVYAGGGSRDRYESGGLINMFRDTLQISLIGVGNNLNRTGFTSNELYSMGGFNRSGQDALWDGSVSLGGRNWGGIEEVASGGFNINNDYGKKLKLNLMYFYSTSVNTNENASSGQQFLNDTTLFSTGAGKNVRKQNKHTINGLMDWKPDTMTQIRYRPRLSFTNNQSDGNGTNELHNNFIPRVNESISSNTSESEQMAFQHTFSFYRRLRKKGESFSLTHNFQISPNGNEQYDNNDLTSFIDSQASDSLRQYTHRKTQNTSANLDISYRYPFSKKFTADITVGGNYYENRELLQRFDMNEETGMYDVINLNQSNDLKRKQWAQRVRPGLTYKLNKSWTIVAGLTAEWQHIANQFSQDVSDLNQDLFNWLPSVRLSGKKFSLSYSESISLPNISDLQPVTLTYSPLYSFTGNPFLKPGRNHNAYANYYTYKPETQVNFNLYLNGSVEENAVVRKRTIQANGAQTSTPVNMNGRYNTYMGGNFGKRFKKMDKWQISINTNVNGGFDRNYFQQNQDEGWQNQYSLRFTQGFSANWNDKLELSPSYRLDQSVTNYKGVSYEDVSILTHNLDTKFTVHWPKKIIWEGNYEYRYNPQVAPGFRKSNNLLNLAVSLQMLKKDRGELKISVYDLLDQNIPAYRYASENSIYDFETKILRRYFLLTYLLKFNKTITK